MAGFDSILSAGFNWPLTALNMKANVGTCRKERRNYLKEKTSGRGLGFQCCTLRFNCRPLALRAFFLIYNGITV